jgi:hypothetical protein
MSKKSAEMIYLGRDGKVFGPYSAAKLEEFRLTGEIRTFTYQWDESAEQWRNLDPLPPRPGATPSRNRGESALETSDVICHDYNALVTGKLRNVTDMGCELVSYDEADAPVLGLNSALVLNVTDAKGEKSTNTRAAVHQISFQEGAWIYHIRWAHRPL